MNRCSRKHFLTAWWAVDKLGRAANGSLAPRLPFGLKAGIAAAAFGQSAVTGLLEVFAGLGVVPGILIKGAETGAAQRISQVAGLQVNGTRLLRVLCATEPLGVEKSETVAGPELPGIACLGEERSCPGILLVVVGVFAPVVGSPYRRRLG
jgi:hypothetical protein